MKRVLSVLLLASSACASTPTERVLTLRYVVDNAEALDGQVIFVNGWVQECGRLSCPLWDSADEVGKEWGYFLSIGPSRGFDRFAENHAPTRVTLRARFHDKCIVNPATQTIVLCADRPETLEVLDHR